MPLDQKTIEILKEKLLEEKTKLEKNLSNFANPSETEDDYKTIFREIGTDPDENASEVEEYTDNLALENNLEKQLAKIDRALERIKNGTYGICSKCGKEIELERLEIYPEAERCIKCANK